VSLAFSNDIILPAAL